MASSSSDEGEIRDSGLDKATTSPQLKGTSVDRPDRTRSRYSPSPSLSIEGSITSAFRRSTERSRSPRGSKRYRDDDQYARGHDPRRFKVHYESQPSDRRRPQRSYEDLDRGGPAPTGLQYDDRDRDRYRYGDRYSRTRSRSPYRAPRESDTRGRYEPTSTRDGRRGDKYDLSDRPRVNGFEYHKTSDARKQSVSKRADGPVPPDVSKQEAKTVQGSSQQLDDSSRNGFVPQR